MCILQNTARNKLPFLVFVDSTKQKKSDHVYTLSRLIYTLSLCTQHKKIIKVTKSKPRRDPVYYMTWPSTKTRSAVRISYL